MMPRRPSLTENKLLLLYSVDRLGPVTAEQLLRFVVEYDLMDYITLQLALAELYEAALLRKQAHPVGMLYALSEDGIQTLRLFGRRVPASRVQCVDEAMGTWKTRFARERHMLADYTALPDGEFDLRLQILEEGVSLMELKLRVPTHGQALAFCQAWSHQASAVYGHIMRALSAGDESGDVTPGP